MKRRANRLHDKSAVLAFGGMTLLSVCAFSLAARLTLGSQESPAAAEGSLTEALLGEVRVLLGDRLYKQADVYFHRGLDYKLPDTALTGNWATRVHRELEPDEHLHAEGEQQIREIMPWLEMTMRVNPDDQESVLVAAYWLGRRLGRPDLAEQVLLRAQRQTPFAYAVQLEKAKLFLHEARREPAMAALNAAIAFWERTGNPEDEADRLAKAEALLLRALLLETFTRPQDAVADYRALLALFPDRPGPRQRLEALTQSHVPHPPAEALLTHMMTQAAQAHHCEHDEH